MFLFTKLINQKSVEMFIIKLDCAKEVTVTIGIYSVSALARTFNL